MDLYLSFHGYSIIVNAIKLCVESIEDEAFLKYDQGVYKGVCSINNVKWDFLGVFLVFKVQHRRLHVIFGICLVTADSLNPKVTFFIKQRF